MTKLAHDFAGAAALPLPDEIRPGPGWTEQMLEMADHIGAKATLQFVERFGGHKIYIPADPHNGKIAGTIRDAIGAHATAILCRVYRREYIEVPAARYALARARRHAVIAAVRAGDISVMDAALILKTRRTYLSFLVNQTDEGLPSDGAPHRSAHRMPGQMDLFGADEDDAD